MATRTAGVKIKGLVTVVMCWGPMYLCTLFTFFAPAPFIPSLFVFLPLPRRFPSTDLIVWVSFFSLIFISLSRPYRCLALSPWLLQTHLLLTLFAIPFIPLLCTFVAEQGFNIAKSLRSSALRSALQTGKVVEVETKQWSSSFSSCDSSFSL